LFTALTFWYIVVLNIACARLFSDVMCCAGVFPAQFMQLPVNELNLEGWLMQVNRDHQTVSVEQVPIRQCDLMANNGVVHVVDRFVSSAISRYVRVGGRSRSGHSSSTSLVQSIQDFLGLS
jgi:Fasciclin domain